jgi:hypothetical protein
MPGARDRRILATHTGSLPRPDDLLPLLVANESGTLADPDGFNARQLRNSCTNRRTPASTS